MLSEDQVASLEVQGREAMRAEIARHVRSGQLDLPAVEDAIRFPESPKFDTPVESDDNGTFIKWRRHVRLRFRGVPRVADVYYTIDDGSEPSSCKSIRIVTLYPPRT